MKQIISFLAVALLATASYAQQEDTELKEFLPPGPHISFKEKSHDFGDIRQGDKVQHIFEFTNDGDAPLVISSVNVTCGCTAPNWPRTPIAPGASSKIEVVFNSSGKVGHQNKIITINSNATNNPDRIKIVTNVLLEQKETEEGS